MIHNFFSPKLIYPYNEDVQTISKIFNNQESFREQIRTAFNPFKLRFFVKTDDGIYPDAFYDYSSLEYAIYLEDEESLRYLLNLKSCSKYFSDSLIFFYMNNLKENLPPNLEILKLLLDRMSDINVKLYYPLQDGETNALDLAIFNMACFQKLHMSVIEELFHRGAKSCAVGVYSAFEQLKTHKFGLSSTVFKISECVTPTEMDAIFRKELFPKISLGRNILQFNYPVSRTFFRQIEGRFRLGSNITSEMYALETIPIGYVSKNPGLKNLYKYVRMEKEYFPNSKTLLTVKEFESHLYELSSLINSIIKIYSHCSVHYPPSHKTNEKACSNVFWKEHVRPLSIVLIDKNKISLEALEMGFSEYCSIPDSIIDENPMIVCNSGTPCTLLLERLLYFFNKSIHKHKKYFNALVKEGRFEDCFDQKQIKNLTFVMGELLKSFPVNQELINAELSQHVRQQAVCTPGTLML